MRLNPHRKIILLVKIKTNWFSLNFHVLANLDLQILGQALNGPNNSCRLLYSFINSMGQDGHISLLN